MLENPPVDERLREAGDARRTAIAGAPASIAASAAPRST
jgi:hypothetical protein